MRATLAGLGARAAIDAGGSGTVIASFPKACYITAPGGLLALVAPTVHPGPLHLVLDGTPPAPRPGTPVEVSAAGVTIAGRRVAARGARTWVGAVPDPTHLRAGAPLAISVLRGASARSALVTERYRERAERARASLLDGLLEEAVDLLAGLGPGLTPAGDDALGGVLFAIRAASGTRAEPRSTRAAVPVPTTELARAFLHWAARGQALAPAHALLKAIARRDASSAVRARDELMKIGETSGADFALGLAWGLEAATGSAYSDATSSP